MSDIQGNVINVQISGPASAVKAKKLAEPRKITLGGDLEGSVEFDGSQDVELEAKVVKVQESTKPDWNQNDETQADYIQNRPGAYDKTVPGVTITWDGDTTGKVNTHLDTGDIFTAVKVSDAILTKAQLVGATADGETILADNVTEQTGYVKWSLGGKCLYSFSQTGNVVIVEYEYTADIAETGTYYYIPKIQPLPANLYIAKLVTASTTEAVKIPAKYLDLGAYVANGDTEIILASSTTGSTKKFKITVDDSGTLTATEVTTS